MKTILFLKHALGMLLSIVMLQSFAKTDCYKPLRGQLTEEYITINIKYNGSVPGDTLVLTMFNMMNPFQNKNITKTAGKDGLFRFKVFIDEDCGYWELKQMDRNFSKSGDYIYRPLTIPFFWEKRDSINVEITNFEKQLGAFSNYKFSGFAIEKYVARAAIFDPELPTKISQQDSKFKPLTVAQVENQAENITKERLKILENNALRLSNNCYRVFKADILSQDTKYALYKMKQYLKSPGYKLNTSSKKEFLRSYKKSIEEFLDEERTGITNSLTGIKYLDYKLQALAFGENGKDAPLHVYNMIKSMTDGKLRERLMLFHLLYDKTYPAKDSLYKDAKTLFQSKHGIDEFKKIDYLFTRKKVFKDYLLYDTKGDSLNISQYKGKVVVMDFWFTGCQPCANYYANTLSKVESIYKSDPRIVFVSVSVDRNREIWLNGIASGKYTSPEVINLNTAGFYHEILSENGITKFPTVLLIAKTGVIKYFETENLYQIDSLKKAIDESL